MFLSTACVCHQHVGAYLRLLAISGVCDKHAGASFRLLPAVSVLYQYLGPSLMLHSIAAGLWEYSLDGSFGIFTIAASVFGHCLIFCRQIIIFFFSNFATRGPVLTAFCRQIIVFFQFCHQGFGLLCLKCGQMMFWTIW